MPYEAYFAWHAKLLKTFFMFHLSSPRRLSSFRRFDVFIKTLFSAYPELCLCGVSPEELYINHLRIWNGFFEREPPRSSLEDFKRDFLSIRSAECPLSLPPVSLSPSSDLLNGSHRLANALAQAFPVSVDTNSPQPGQDYVTLQYLLSRGFLRELPSSIVNFLVLFAFHLSRRQSLLILWDTSYLNALLETLPIFSLQPVLYATSSIPSNHLSEQVFANLVRLIYCDSDWLYDQNGEPSGSFYKATQVSSQNPIGLLLVESDSKNMLDTSIYEQVSAAKIAFRASTSTAHSVLHSADNFAQSWAVLSTLLNNGSSFSTLSRLFSPCPRGFFALHGFPSLEESIDQYWRCALTSTSAMQAYGLPITPSDLDVVCHHTSPMLPLYGHYSERSYYPFSQDELSSNLSFSYHHMGVRVLKPSVVYAFKLARSEPKDLKHLLLIDSLLSRSSRSSLTFNLQI